MNEVCTVDKRGFQLGIESVLEQFVGDLVFARQFLQDLRFGGVRLCGTVGIGYFHLLEKQFCELFGRIDVNAHAAAKLADPLDVGALELGKLGVDLVEPRTVDREPRFFHVEQHVQKRQFDVAVKPQHVALFERRATFVGEREQLGGGGGRQSVFEQVRHERDVVGVGQGVRRNGMKQRFQPRGVYVSAEQRGECGNAVRARKYA